jgi:prophage tail gpP-like protein
MRDTSSPIELESYPAGQELGSAKRVGQSLTTFSSYSFARDMLVPASPFRFTAEGVDYAKILAIRSGDTSELWISTPSGDKVQLATGFIDETDAHTTASTDEYVLTGRDTLGQLVDNAAIDANNKIIHLDQVSLPNLALTLIKNTRMPQQIENRGCPTGLILFRTNPGETKINSLQKYLEYTNCQAWTLPNGVLAVGKPNMAQEHMGALIMKRSDPRLNNVLDIRSRRNVNAAIRQIAVQLQTQNLVDPASITILNADKDMLRASKFGAGKSVYRSFSLGNGEDAVNQLILVGNNGTPQQIGHALALRELARGNMQLLDVECVVRGHVNENGTPYNIDQVYHVEYEKDAVDEDMYVHSVSYDLTKDRGRTTTLKLCRLGTLVADVPYKKA